MQLTMSMRRKAGPTCADHKPTHANHKEEMGCAQADFFEHEKEGWDDPRRSRRGFALTREDHKDRRSWTDTRCAQRKVPLGLLIQDHINNKQDRKKSTRSHVSADCKERAWTMLTMVLAPLARQLFVFVLSFTILDKDLC